MPKTIKYPLNFPPSPDIKGHFEFSPPSKIKITGSYLLETNLRTSPNVNLTIEIPRVRLWYMYYSKAVSLAHLACFRETQRRKREREHINYNTCNTCMYAHRNVFKRRIT